MGNINTKMGNITSKKRLHQSQYRSLSPCSDTESMSVVSSMASNPTVAKRLSQAEGPPRVPSRQMTTPSLVRENPSRSDSRNTGQKTSSGNSPLPEIPMKICRIRSDSCGGTVNSPLSHAHACRKSPEGARSPEGQSLCYRGVCPASESSFKNPEVHSWRTENVPPPYRDAPRLPKGHRLTKLRDLSMAPQNEQHRWTWNLQSDSDNNTGRVSEKDINSVLRRVNAVVRGELSHSMADNDQYKLEVKLTKIHKTPDHCARNHREAEKIYSVPLRKHLVAREMAAESPRPTLAAANAWPANKPRQQKSGGLHHDDLVRILAQNHQRNKIALLPAVHAKAPPTRRERATRQWERLQKNRFEMDFSMAPESPAQNFHQRMVQPKSTLI